MEMQKSTPPSCKLQVRINQIDYTVVPPGPLDATNLPRAPVLRVYGTTSLGKNACVHVHQVYPYIFVDYEGEVQPRKVTRYISRLFHSLNHAIALSFKKQPNASKAQFIRAVLLVKGVDFYGFHASYSPFLKILVADPGLVGRIVALLQSGSVMGTRFRVYESHLSFILQFLCDFGLYGCGLIDLEDAQERGSSTAIDTQEDRESAESSQQHFTVSPHFRETRSPLEFDAIAPHILNRHRLTPRNVHHRLQIPGPEMPTEPFVLSVRELWEEERAHRAHFGLNPSPVIPPDPSESSRSERTAWVAEARWWDELRMRIENERGLSGGGGGGEGGENPRPTADLEKGWEPYVMTTFESVEALWEPQHKTWKPDKKEKTPSHSVEGRQDEVNFDGLETKLTLLDDESIQVEVDLTLLSEEEIGNLDQPDAGEDVDKNLHDEEGDLEHEEDHDHEEDQEEDQEGPSEEIIPQSSPGSPPNPFVDQDSKLNEDIPDEDGIEYQLSSPPPLLNTDSREDRPQTPTPTNARDFIVYEHERDTTPTPSGKHRNQSADAVHTPTNPLKSTRFTLTEVDEEHPKDRSRPEVHVGDLGTLGIEQDAGFISDTDKEERQKSLIAARAVIPATAFQIAGATGKNRYQYSIPPPTSAALLGSLAALGLPNKIYTPAHYSRDHDLPESDKEFAGIVYQMKGGQGIATLDEWRPTRALTRGDQVQDDDDDDDDDSSPGTLVRRGGFGGKNLPRPRLDPSGVGGWEYAALAPSPRQVRRTVGDLISPEQTAMAQPVLQSQIEGPTQTNVFGSKATPQEKDSSRQRPVMTIMSVEIFVPNRYERVPDADFDTVMVIAYAYHVSGEEISKTGILVLDDLQLAFKRVQPLHVEVHKTELDLLNALIDLTVDLDPDIITGWNVQNESLGFLERRAQTLGLSFSELISRAPPRPSSNSHVDRWRLRKSSTLKVTGRHVFNLWRTMRSERTLTLYTFENVVFNVLKRRVPRYSFQTMTDWYTSDVPMHAVYLLRHLSMRARTNLELLEATDTVTKTAEFARVFGVDFFSVITRGSQFKVESFMFRIAKPESFVLPSPSVHDVGRQNAAECMPLIMEPSSAFYTDPMVVLDFQSLYPSVMIAYNYCYSTCLGRVQPFGDSFKFGVVDDMRIKPELLAKLKDYITIAPNGIMYVKPYIRKGLLGRMLVELLDTRVMVKQAMKGADKARRRILEARQLGLKYIANVTYGYTSASFSGRMPAVEVADSIVQTGRETLEKAIDVINDNPRWGAKVVYGDTDSVFVYLPGKTKEQAFAIGNDISETITKINPVPIKLKFEKVYLPCVLMAKKRYVGFKYEKVDETEPTFDAKGIETVRRDGILAQRKMVEMCLKNLFRTQDLSEVKDYCCRTWTKILENKAPVQDFIFAKEVKLGMYSGRGLPPPGAVVAARRMVKDPRNEAQYGERVPYVIVKGMAGEKLANRAMDPVEFMNDEETELDANYYITRVLIPPLERIFNLVGVDVKAWFTEMPKGISAVPELVSPRKTKELLPAYPLSPGKFINAHFATMQCLACGSPAHSELCGSCYNSPQETLSAIQNRVRAREKRWLGVHRVCSTCTGTAPSEEIHCDSIDCPWFYERRKAERGAELVPVLEELSQDYEDELLENEADRERGVLEVDMYSTSSQSDDDDIELLDVDELSDYNENNEYALI